MFRRPTKEINAEFLAEDRYLENIQRVVREACRSVGLSSKDSNAVLLAIEERLVLLAALQDIKALPVLKG